VRERCVENAGGADGMFQAKYYIARRGTNREGNDYLNNSEQETSPL
jgi:hypothetical protein